MIYAILIVEIVILICRLIRSYKLMNDKKREYNIDYWIAPVMYGKWSYAYAFAHMLSTFSIVVLSLVIFYNEEIDYESANLMIFMFFVTTIFIYIIEPTIIKAMEVEVPLAVDKMENTELPPKKEVPTSVKRIQKVRYIIVGFLAVLMLLFFIIIEVVVMKKDESAYMNKTDEECLILHDTNVFIDNKYIYSFSNKTSCLNVYDLKGNFLNSWIIPYISSGDASAYEYNDMIYIQNRNYEVYAYLNNEYYGKMIDCGNEVEVYDKNDKLLYKYDVSDSEYAFYYECFDYENVYAKMFISSNVSKKMIISKDKIYNYQYALSYFDKSVEDDNNIVKVYKDKIVLNDELVVTDNYNFFYGFIVNDGYTAVLTILFVVSIVVIEILIKNARKQELKKKNNSKNAPIKFNIF